jgi:predicted TIM-barrel fold metal-dependent hydrolase
MACGCLRAVAQTPQATDPSKIDIHVHYLPPEYRRLAAEAGHSKPDGMPGLPPWDPERAIAMMDQMNIQAGVLSISSPGVHFANDEAARKLSRYVNEEGAKAAQKYPGRFGLFASLPLPDVEGALVEIKYAYDELKADGVVLSSNFQGVYLGDPKLDAVFAELNTRNAIVFIHPTSPSCQGCIDVSMGYPRPMIEFLFETTRTVTNLILSGTLDKYPNIRVIVPHAGATLPLLADRIIAVSPILQLPRPINEEYFFGKLRGLYYDTAGFPVPRQLAALQQIADPSRIVYGSDWPFTRDQIVASLAKKLGETTLLDAASRQAIYRENALALFPRFRR